jgi:hypothetical protein
MQVFGYRIICWHKDATPASWVNSKESFGEGLRGVKMQQSEASLAKGRRFRTREVDLAVERHQHLHSLQLRTPGG